MAQHENSKTEDIVNSNEKSTQQWREDYFKILKVRVHNCLEPTESCNEKAIHAHSIQNANVIDKLEQDGHVVVLKHNHNNFDRPTVEWGRLGRNKASTFTGLCTEHDSSIFRPIDQFPPDLSNPEHLLLIAYRSVLRETHACNEAAVRLQTAYHEQIKQGRSLPNQLDPLGMAATACICNAYDCYSYKRKFDEILLARKYDGLIHEIFRFDATSPSIAVSSLFSLDDMPWPDDVARIALNVFPLQNGVVAIFSSLLSDSTIASQYLQRIRNASGMYQKYLLSKIILQHCDNIVMAPRYYERLSETKRGAIRGFFESTISQNRNDYDDENLYLF